MKRVSLRIFMKFPSISLIFYLLSFICKSLICSLSPVKQESFLFPSQSGTRGAAGDSFCEHLICRCYGARTARPRNSTQSCYSLSKTRILLVLSPIRMIVLLLHFSLRYSRKLKLCLKHLPFYLSINYPLSETHPCNFISYLLSANLRFAPICHYL